MRINSSAYRQCFLIFVGIFALAGLVACNNGENSSSMDGADPGATYIPTLPNERPDEGVLYASVLEEFSIVNSDGNTIYGLIRRPDPVLYPASSFAAVIKVPGGINPGRSEVLTVEAIALAEAGMVVVGFNAEGRLDSRNPDDIQSEGEEDYNGYRNQDTLAEIFLYVEELPYVIPYNIGIRTQSYGITMGAGCVARHPEIPVKYIVDGEGPSASFVTVQEPWALYSPSGHPFHDKYETVYEILGHYSTYRDPSQENLAFWGEREAVRFIGAFDGMYLRLQAEWDHSQPPSQASEINMCHDPPTWWQCKHACDMANAAVQGGVPWVRVNFPEQGNEVNDTFGPDNLPGFLPGELNSDPMIPVRAVLEMARSEW